MKLHIPKKLNSIKTKRQQQDIYRLIEKETQKKKKISLLTYIKFIFSVFFEPSIKLVQLSTDLMTVLKLILFNKLSQSSFFKPWVPFNVSKWIYITTIPITLLIIIFKTIQAFLLIKNTNNIILIYLNTFAKKITTIKKGIPFFLVFEQIKTNSTSKTEQTNFNRLCFFTWEQLHNWQFVLLNAPKQIINALTLWSLIISKDQTNLEDMSSLSGILSKIKQISQDNKQEAVILSGMLISLIAYSILAFVFLFGVACLIYIENELLANDSGFGDRWIPFLREENSSLKKYILLQLLQNIQQMKDEEEEKEESFNARIEIDHNNDENSLYCESIRNKQWLEIDDKSDCIKHVKTPSRVYKYV